MHLVLARACDGLKLEFEVGCHVFHLGDQLLACLEYFTKAFAILSCDGSWVVDTAGVSVVVFDCDI